MEGPAAGRHSGNKWCHHDLMPGRDLWRVPVPLGVRLRPSQVPAGQGRHRPVLGEGASQASARSLACLVYSQISGVAPGALPPGADPGCPWETQL